MSDAPSWLTEENVSTATTLAKNPVVQKQAKKAASNPAVQKAAKDQIKKEMGYTPPVADNAPGWANGQQADVETGGSARPKSTADASASTEFIIDELTLKNMQNYHLALRILYIGASVSLAAAAALSLENQNDVGLVFIAFYVLFFSILICCFEAAISVSGVIHPFLLSHIVYIWEFDINIKCSNFPCCLLLCVENALFIYKLMLLLLLLLLPLLFSIHRWYLV